MSITRSKIARQMYADGALVDPRMANTLEQNKAINDAATLIANARRSGGQQGVANLLSQNFPGISNPNQIPGFTSSNSGFTGTYRAANDQLTKALAQQLNSNVNANTVVGSSYREPPKPPTDMFGILISDHDKYGVGSDPTKVSEADMNAFRQRVLDAQKNYYQKELDLINQDYISSGYPDQAMTLEEYMRSIGAYAKGGRAGFANGSGYSDYASPSSTTASQDFATQATSGGTDWGGNNEVQYYPTVQPNRITTTSDFDTNVNKATRTLGILGAGMNLVKTLGAKSLMSYPGALAALEFYNAIKGNNQNYAKGGRAGYAYGGSTYDEAGTTTPSSSFDFSPSDSGGGGNDEVSYYPTTAQLNATLSGGDGGGGGEDAITNYITPPTKPFTPAADKNKILDIILKNQEEEKRLPAPEPSLFEKFIDVAKYVVAPEVAAIEYGINKFGPPAYTIDRGFNPNAAPTSKTASQTFNQMKSGGTYDVPYTGGGDNQPIIPILPVQTPTDVDNELSDFDIYMQSLGQNRFSLDPRFAAAEGGRARRGYGIGGIIKSVGKAVKKVLKSDVGKAAIGLASLYYGPKLFNEKAGFSSWKNVNFLKSMQDNPLPWILGGSAVAGLASSQEEEDDLDQISDRKDTSGLRELMASYPSLRFQVQKPYQLAAQGGRIGYAEGGMMDLGGMEKDYRAEGGFVPIGAEEKADDVPARLSKNEFVFTADAVRSAGDGDIDKGAEVMYNVMKNLESGGKISDESQGLQGARDMFQTSQRLGEIL